MRNRGLPVIVAAVGMLLAYSTKQSMTAPGQPKTVIELQSAPPVLQAQNLA